MYGLLSIATDKTTVELKLGIYVNSIFNNKCNYLVRKCDDFKNIENRIFIYKWNSLSKVELKTIEKFLDWYCLDMKNKEVKHPNCSFKRIAKPLDIEKGKMYYYENKRFFSN